MSPITVKEFHRQCREIMRKIVKEEWPELSPEEQENKTQYLLGVSEGLIGNVPSDEVQS